MLTLTVSIFAKSCPVKSSPYHIMPLVHSSGPKLAFLMLGLGLWAPHPAPKFLICARSVVLLCCCNNMSCAPHQSWVCPDRMYAVVQEVIVRRLKRDVMAPSYFVFNLDSLQCLMSLCFCTIQSLGFDLVQEVMLRRLKRDVMAELPPKRRQVVRLPCPKPADWPNQEVPEGGYIAPCVALHPTGALHPPVSQVLAYLVSFASCAIGHQLGCCHTFYPPAPSLQTGPIRNCRR